MDEVVLRRVVGVLTLAIAAFLLSWLLPRPGLDRLRGEGERVVTVDLTRPDAQPQEIPPPSDEPPTPAPAAQPAPVPEPEVIAAVEPTSPPPEPVRPVEPPPKPPAAAKPVEAPKAVEPPKPPKPVEAPKPTEPKPVAPAPAPAGGGTGSVMIQAGAFSRLENAEGVRSRAVAQGQRCMIAPIQTPKGTLYRPRCGPYPDRAKAQAAVKALAAAGIDAHVIGGAR